MKSRITLNVYRVYRVRSRRTSRVRYVAEIQYTDRGHGREWCAGAKPKEITKRFRTPSSTRASHVLVNMVLDPLGSVSKARKTGFSPVLGK